MKSVDNGNLSMSAISAIQQQPSEITQVKPTANFQNNQELKHPEDSVDLSVASQDAFKSSKKPSIPISNQEKAALLQPYTSKNIISLYV